MPSSLAESTALCHDKRLDIGKPKQAKASVNSIDMPFIAEVGEAIRRAVIDVWGINGQKVAAGAIGVDTAELSRWFTGERRPHMDRLWAVEAMRKPLCLRLSELAGAVVHMHVEWPERKVG